MKYMNHTKLISIATAFTVLLTGCGKTDPELDTYKKEMTTFTETVTDLVDSINAIDVDSDNRTEELLSYLDEMDIAFTDMAALEVPEEFSNIEELADEASSNLSRAVSLYHEAFDGTGEDFDNNIPREEILSAAHEYYSRAFKRIDFIGTILQGELPDDESVTIIHETETEEE